MIVKGPSETLMLQSHHSNDQVWDGGVQRRVTGAGLPHPSSHLLANGLLPDDHLAVLPPSPGRADRVVRRDRPTPDGRPPDLLHQ